MSTFPLAAEFSVPNRADWQRLVADVLHKSGIPQEDLPAAPEKLLISQTYDGIDIQPLYTEHVSVAGADSPGLPLFTQGSQSGGEGIGWDVRALHTHPDPAVSNAAILDDLEGGATSLWIRVGADVAGKLGAALGGVYLDAAPVTLDPGEHYVKAANAFLDLSAAQEIAPDQMIGSIGADPIGLRARTGQPHAVAPAAELASRLSTQYPRLRTILVDGLPYHEAGGSEAQELGAHIATGVAYLRALTDIGLDVDTAVGQLEFRCAATVDQFLTIAKIRAVRRLWSRVAEVCGVKSLARGMKLHAVTSASMLSKRDPWVNIMRGVIACFAAGIAGADAITVLPFDATIGLPDKFSRRIARNTHHILLQEAAVADVIDPASGSWYVENLTDALTNAAWREFTAIEGEGGIESALDSGFIAQRLDATWQARSQRLATRQDAITGVSEFPYWPEGILPRELSPVSAGNGLPRLRYAQVYEELRDRADAYTARHGEHPTVFLVPMGLISANSDAIRFAANLFHAGGINSINPGEVTTVADATSAYRNNVTPVVCLCASDSPNRSLVASMVQALREVGAKHILLTTKTDDSYPDITGFIYPGCDVLAVLRSTLDMLGVS